MSPRADALPTLDHDGCYLAVIEASAGARSKFKFEPELGSFVLHGVLPIGTSFPYAFGFIPSTLADDGDALDVVVLTDEAPPVGTVVPCRIIAVLEAEQDKKGKRIRNDRILAVAASSERFARWRRREDADKRILERIAAFFEFYHGEQGKKFVPLGWRSAGVAIRLIEAGQARHARKHELRS